MIIEDKGHASIDDPIRRNPVDDEQPDSAPKPEGSLEVGVKVGFLDVL